jgi:hypothetical protein
MSLPEIETLVHAARLQGAFGGVGGRARRRVFLQAGKFVTNALLFAVETGTVHRRSTFGLLFFGLPCSGALS